MRVARYAVVPAVAATLALSACGGGQRTYDVSGEVTGKQTEEECDSSHALGDEAVEIELVSFEGRSTSGGGSSSGGSRSNRNTTSGGSGSVNCHIEYEIFVRGEEDDVDVTEDHYDRCSVGERFPACTGNGQ